MRELTTMERGALEALAARAMADAVGGGERIAAYCLVMQRGESVSDAAKQLGVTRKTAYRWIRGVERYLNTLRMQHIL